MKTFSTGILLLLFTGCQVAKTTQVQTENYPDGKIRIIKTTTVKKNRDFELHENFREEIRVTRAYYHNGKLKMYWKVVYTNGSDASCYESLYKMEEYDSTGIKRSLYQAECDCEKKKVVTYNAKGKVTKIDKTIIKRIE